MKVFKHLRNFIGRVLVLIILLHACKSTQKHQSMKTCFTPENFNKVYDNVQHYNLISSSGTYYLEYPLDTTNIYDGIKRPSNHPENIYKVYTLSDGREHVVLKSSLRTFSFSIEGLKEASLNETDKKLANEIFCHILYLRD